MQVYKVLKNQEFKLGRYRLIPIRSEDRYKIMEWRNDQIFHLRQTEILTEETQDSYFKNVIEKLFNQILPEQILFSFLEDEVCIAYGGLVHIDWKNRNAEISFLIETNREKSQFALLWSIYLKLIEKIAFKELQLHKIFTYAIDLRPKLYPILIEADFKIEAVLKEHIFLNEKFVDVVIHHKINTNE